MSSNRGSLTQPRSVGSLSRSGSKAKVDIPNYELEDKFFDAIKEGNTDEIEALVKDEDGKSLLQKYTSAGHSPVTYAAVCSKKKAMAALLELGADVNAPDSMGNTALMIATCHGQNSMIKLLLRHPNIDILQRNQYDESVVHWATMYGRANLLKDIEDKVPASLIHEENRHGISPYGFAVGYDRSDARKVLNQISSSGPVVVQTQTPATS